MRADYPSLVRGISAIYLVYGRPFNRLEKNAKE